MEKSCKKCEDLFDGPRLRMTCFKCCPKSKKWTKEECRLAASICKSRSEFLKSFEKQYRYAIDKGWSDEICSHMQSKICKFSREECIEVALKCDTKREFRKKYPKHWNHAWRKYENLPELNEHFNYYPIIYDLEIYEKCFSIASKCENFIQFRTQHNDLYSYAVKNKFYNEIKRKLGKTWTVLEKKPQICSICSNEFYSRHRERLRCFDCLPESTKITNTECLETALRFKTRGEFKSEAPKQYSYAVRHKLLDLACSHMPIKDGKLPIERGLEIARSCSSRSDFRNKYPLVYRGLLKKGVSDQLDGLLPQESPMGFRKSGFVSKCLSNNQGLGTLYLLQLIKGGERFYKIGITSRTVDKRCGGGLSNYSWKIVWQVTADSKEIWKKEQAYKNEIRKLRIAYAPQNPFGGSATECFKCHGNCKILRKPDLTNQ